MMGTPTQWHRAPRPPAVSSLLLLLLLLMLMVNLALARPERALDGVEYAPWLPYSDLGRYEGMGLRVANGTHVLLEGPRGQAAELTAPRLHVSYGGDCIYEGGLLRGKVGSEQ